MLRTFVPTQYFDGPTKLFSDLYLPKFLIQQNRSFRVRETFPGETPPSSGILPQILNSPRERKFTNTEKSVIKLKVKQQVISIYAQVLRVTVLTARWRPVLESLFRCSPAESLTLSLSLSFLSTFLVFLSVAFILPSLSFSLLPLSVLHSPSLSVFPSSPFSSPSHRSLTPILEFFYLHEGGNGIK